jgi:hypothetical protein
MAQHGMRHVLMQQDHGLAYAEVLEYTHQVSAAVLEEVIRCVKMHYTNNKIDIGKQRCWCCNDEAADISWNAAVNRLAKVMDKMKFEILKK